MRRDSIQEIPFRRTELTASEWAAWVQAVGSITAILVAVGVAAYQNASQRRLEKKQAEDEITGLLRAIYDDLALSCEALHLVHTEIANLPQDRGFGLRADVPDEQFVVYNGLAPRIGAISDSNLRMRIVRCYTAAKALHRAFVMNNQLIDQVERQAYNRAAGLRTLAGQQLAQEKLDRFGIIVKDAYNTFVEHRGPLMKQLDHLWQ